MDLADPHAARLVTVLDSAHNYVFQVAFTPDGRYLAAASADTHAYVWRLASGRPVGRPFVIGGTASHVYSVAFSPTSDLLAVGGNDHRVRLFRLHDASRPTRIGRALAGPTDAVYGVAFAPHGGDIAGASQEGAIYVWSRTGTMRERLATDGGDFTVAYSPDGSQLYGAGNDKLVHRWQADPATADSKICAATGAPLSHNEWRQEVAGLTYRSTC